MQAADIPTRFPIPWANSAISPFIRPVPEVPTPEEGAASLNLGFPPSNFSPVSSGGVPPFGADFNGILNQITAWARWQAAGGVALYNGAYQTTIGGYMAGAIVASASTVGLLWYSTTDNNATNPDSGGAGWMPVWLREGTRFITASGAFTTTIADCRVGLNRTSGVAISSTALPTTNLFTGFKVRYEDLVGNFRAFPLTVSAPGGHTIAGLTSYACNADRQSVEFAYYGSSLWGVA